MKYLSLILVSILLVSGCVTYTEKADNTTENNQTLQECKRNSDCVPAGCSGEVCAPKGSDIVTTCEVRPEYECLKLTSCGCVENKCAWEENPEYQACLEEKKNSDIGPVF